MKIASEVNLLVNAYTTVHVCIICLQMYSSIYVGDYVFYGHLSY